jgi:hypothetical protein
VRKSRSPWFDEAHQSYPLYFSALFQVRRGNVTAIHQPRPHAGIRLLVTSMHEQELLHQVLVNAVLADTHRIFLHEAVLLDDNGEIGERWCTSLTRLHLCCS